MPTFFCSSRQLLALSAVVIILLAGCGGTPAVDGAARNIEAYLQARVASDTDRMIGLSCAAWEPTAKVEATSFKSLKARLDGVACTAATGAAGDAVATVTCNGKILTTYNGEDRELNLADKPFNSVLEAGEWRMCGYR